MMIWTAVVLAGLGSYAMRLAPLLWGARLAMGERTQQVLRHAGMGGIAALVIYSVVGTARGGDLIRLVPTVSAIVLAGVLAVRGRSMTVALIAGGAVQLGAAFLLGA